MKASVILVTGCAGFIGSSLSLTLINQGHNIIGVDNLCPSYNPIFKRSNLKMLMSSPKFCFYKCDILDNKKILKIGQLHKPAVVVHLAALTGVRSSINKSTIYGKVNIAGTQNVFKVALYNKSNLFIFSSSSSIYGNINRIPFKENQKPDPKSPYARTKVAAEIFLKRQSIKYKVPTTILRLFSVYGPRGRPDMAPYLFTEAAYSQKKITLYGNGSSSRDYTYIDDVIKAFDIVINRRIGNTTLNIGNSDPVHLSDLLRFVEVFTKKKLQIQHKPYIHAEAQNTYADTSKAKTILQWVPKTSFPNGLKKFINWYKNTRLSQ